MPTVVSPRSPIPSEASTLIIRKRKKACRSLLMRARWILANWKVGLRMGAEPTTTRTVARLGGTMTMGDVGLISTTVMTTRDTEIRTCIGGIGLAFGLSGASQILFPKDGTYCIGMTA